MALVILLLLLIGLGSTSAQVPHCVPCTEPFQQFDYNNACNSLLKSTGYISDYQQPLLVPVFDIRKRTSDRSVSVCVPCSESFANFDAICDNFTRKFIESQRYENTNICNETNNEVFYEERCQILLEQGTCPEKHWLVLNDIQTGPVCEYNKCFDSKSLSVVNYEGLCLNLSTEDGYECEENKVLVVSTDGTADCECFDDDMVKLPNTGECFTTRQRTSECAPNWMLEKSFDGNPVCVRNFCSESEMYWHGRCWLLSPECKVGSIVIFEPKKSYIEGHENIIRCRIPLLGISNSQRARPIGICAGNAGRVGGRCPGFSMRKKLPFE